MGTRTRTSAPPVPVGMRDYRTLTLPAVDKPVSVLPYREPDVDPNEAYEFEVESSFEQGRPSEVTQNRVRGNFRSDIVHLDPPSRTTRTLMAAGSLAKHDVAPRRHYDGAAPHANRYDVADTLIIQAQPRHTQSVVVPARRTGAVVAAPSSLAERVVGQAGRRPIGLIANLVLLAVAAAALVVPHFAQVDAASGCTWHTVVRNDTLGNLGYENHTTAMAIARANHIANPNLIYVGQRVCIPVTSWAQAPSAPAKVSGSPVALPLAQVQSSGFSGNSIPVNQLPAGEPCTADRSLVWTVPVSRWAIPPGCFGGIYSPNPNNFLVNGHVIPGFGWCNWWPEALLRNPRVIDLPRHSTPRPGVAVYWAPQPGDKTGHYGFVESIGTGKNAGWILISEMNMYWRGGGWQKVDYRYIRVDYPGANYLYN